MASTWTKPVVLRADDIEPFSYDGSTQYLSQQVVGSENGGAHDMLLNRGTLQPHAALPGESHADNDEIYYIVSGQSWLDLGGDAESGEGAQAYRVEPGMVVVIPAGTFHRLRNDTDTELVILTIWPQPQRPGANKLHDKRRQTWGTGFKLRQGRELVGPILAE
jgi:mannose-6-phosphate isomerase-like protein (cupin superfamily)